MSHHMTLPTTSLTSGLTGLVSAAKRGLTAKATTPTAGAPAGTPTGASTGAAASSTSSLDTTFLSLLVQELQNQDPTAPMDSTAMVGQMISLNQLDQLTSINQTLSTAYPGKSSTATTAGTSSGTVAEAGSGTGTKANELSATQAALRLLSTNSTAERRAVSPSVSLPAF